MQTVTIDYLELMQGFLKGTISVTDFETRFLNLFKAEVREIDKRTFEILDTVFGDIDSFTTDASLIADSPDFYLDEAQLRAKIKTAVDQLVITNGN